MHIKSSPKEADTVVAKWVFSGAIAYSKHLHRSISKKVCHLWLQWLSWQISCQIKYLRTESSVSWHCSAPQSIQQDSLQGIDHCTLFFSNAEVHMSSAIHRKPSLSPEPLPHKLNLRNRHSLLELISKQVHFAAMRQKGLEPHMCNTEVHLPDLCGHVMEAHPHWRQGGHNISIMGKSDAHL